MKRVSFIMLAVASAAALVIGVSINRSARAVSITINVKDLPEQGLHIIGPSNPSFEPMLAKVVGKRSAIAVETIRPYSFFLRNNGSKNVIAYKIRWECTKSDGSVIYKDSSMSSAWIFMDEIGRDHRRTLSRANGIIRPNTTWFYSLVLAPRQVDDAPIGLEHRDGWAVVSRGSSAQEQSSGLDEA